MLSKKYYKEIARIIKSVKAQITNIPNCTPETAIEVLEDTLSDYFKYDNINFDKTKFKEACKL